MAEQGDVLRSDDATSDEGGGAEARSLTALRRRLAPALVAMAARGETAKASGARFEDVSFYLDENQFDQERVRFFQSLPLVACMSSELPLPGSFRTFDEAGVPMLILRGKDSKVRAFLNICPHRGARIVRTEQGKANRFACRFHGWTFDSSGEAIGVPEEANFCGEISGQKHLFQCPAEERHGLVFIQATPGGSMDLDKYLEALDGDLAVIGLDQSEIVHADVLQVPANWKYGLDTFFETYHLNSLHRDTFKGLFSPVCVLDTFGPHHRFTFAPLDIDAWADRPESEWNVDSIPLQYFLFPNTIISVGSTSPSGSTVNMHQILPSSVGQFSSKLGFIALGGVRSEAHRAEINAAYAVSRQALVNEDYSVVGESWSGFHALPAGTKMPIGRHEIGVQNFHRNVEHLLAL